MELQDIFLDKADGRPLFYFGIDWKDNFVIALRNKENSDYTHITFTKKESGKIIDWNKFKEFMEEKYGI